MTRMPRPYRDEIRPVMRQDIKDLERSCYEKAILNNVLQTTPPPDSSRGGYLGPAAAVLIVALCALGYFFWGVA